MTVDGILTNLAVVVFQNSQIFASFAEFAFFHALADVPVHESPLGVHQIEFAVQTDPSVANSSRVGQHAESAGNFGQIAARNDGRRLVIDSHLNVIKKSALVQLCDITVLE